MNDDNKTKEQLVAELQAIRRRVAELEQADQALKTSEEKYRQLVETASDAIYIVSEDGLIIDTNESACAALGWTKKELIGKTISDIDPNFSVEKFKRFWESIGFDQQEIFETTHQKKTTS